jgi:hypothetical protein
MALLTHLAQEPDGELFSTRKGCEVSLEVGSSSCGGPALMEAPCDDNNKAASSRARFPHPGPASVMISDETVGCN